MTPEEYHNDMLYHAAVSMGKSLLEKGLITQEEYAEIDTILLQKYSPYLGGLLSENRLLYPFFRVIDSTPKGGTMLENH